MSKIRQQQQSDRKQSYNENENTARFQIQKQQPTYQEYGKRFELKIIKTVFSCFAFIILILNGAVRIDIFKILFSIELILLLTQKK